MPKLTIDDLKKIKENYRATETLRAGGYRYRIKVHMGTCGIAAGAREIMSTILDEIEKKNLTNTVVTASGCAGLCSREPIITIEEGNETPVKYADVTSEKAREIIELHILEGTVAEKYALVVGNETSY